MRKFLYYLFPIIILGLFIVIMSSDKFLKKPLGRRDNVPFYLAALQKDIQTAKWDQAGTDLAKLQRAYRLVIPRIQFGAERDEMNRIQVNLVRTAGAISARDKAAGLAEVLEAGEHWRGLGK